MGGGCDGVIYGELHGVSEDIYPGDAFPGKDTEARKLGNINDLLNTVSPLSISSLTLYRNAELSGRPTQP